MERSSLLCKYRASAPIEFHQSFAGNFLPQLPTDTRYANLKISNESLIKFQCQSTLNNYIKYDMSDRMIFLTIYHDMYVIIIFLFAHIKFQFIIISVF